MSDSRVDYTKLFLLRDPLGNRALRLELLDEDDTFTIGTSVKLFRGELSLDRVLRLRGYMGGQPMDILWSGLPAIVVVSERLVSLLRENQITGWSTYPVEVWGRKGEPLPGYHGLSITGRAGSRDLTRGEIITKPPIVPGAVPPRVRKGFYFYESTWDGSDIFVLENSLWRVVTGKMRHLFTRAKIRNVTFSPLPEVEIHLDGEET